jgi:CRP-like cAMP-binding protein
MRFNIKMNSLPNSAPNSVLKSFPFFKNFPSEMMEAIESIAKERSFSKGEVLLHQGKENKRLFFLKSGRLSVQVDGEIVSHLSAIGEVVGEMSLINRKPVTASVVADSDVVAIEVSEESLDSSKHRGLLDRVYASVLAERLTQTNEKAKRFEIANRDLALAQQSLQRNNDNLEFEIARRSKELVQKVQELTESHLRPTQVTLSKMTHGDSKPVPITELYGVLQSVTEVIDFLKPVTDLQSRKQSMVSRHVLLLDPSKKQQNIAKLALGGTGIDLSLASTVEEFTELLNSHEYDAIICDAELKQAAVLALQMKPGVPLVLLVGLDMMAYLGMLEEFPDRVFFVSRDKEDRTFTIKNIATTVTKIVNQDLFGLEKYLARDSRILESPVNDSKGRVRLIEDMTAHFKSLGVRSTMLERVHTSAEEMLMNAIYDAPTGTDGKPLYNHLPRSQQILLNSEQEATLRFGTDGILLGVAVSDPFGTLTKSIIMKYLDSCYRDAAGSLNAEKGGAGRGLKMMIDSADLTIFNIVAGRKTEVISLFNLDVAPESESKSTFHLFHMGKMHHA